MIQALQEAKRTGALPSRFEIDALPEAGRTYQRPAEDEVAETSQNAAGAAGAAASPRETTPRSPSPDLFYKERTRTRAPPAAIVGVPGRRKNGH